MHPRTRVRDLLYDHVSEAIRQGSVFGVENFLVFRFIGHNNKQSGPRAARQQGSTLQCI